MLGPVLAFMYERNYAAATITTYFSAIQALHKLIGLADIGLSFVNRKLLASVQKARASNEQRLPITIHILHKLV